MSSNVFANEGVVFCTPMQLIKLLVRQPDLVSSSRFILDEFHTRTIALDVLFALLRQKKADITKPFQFVMMSATPDPKIVESLPNSKTLEIQDCSPYHVTKERVVAQNTREAATVVPGQVAAKYVKEVVAGTKPHGNVLCFTSGQKECEKVCEEFESQLKSEKKIVCFSAQQYAKMDSKQAVYKKIEEEAAKPENKDQMFVIPVVMAGKALAIEKQLAVDPLPSKIADFCIKMIAATNIVETSITIEKLVCLVDSGMFKEATYDEGRGITVLKEKQVSEAQRDQRAGRVGRVMDGYAYLVDLDKSKKMDAQQKPEIQRIDLKQSILELKKIGIDLETLQGELPQRPNKDDLESSLRVLRGIGALNAQSKITDFGAKLLLYKNVDPITGYVMHKVIEKNRDWLLPVVIAYSILSEPHDLLWGEMSAELAKKAVCPESDLVTAVRCYIEIEKSNDQIKFMKENQINQQAFKKIRYRVREIYQCVVENNEDIFVGIGSDGDEDDEFSDETVLTTTTVQKAKDEVLPLICKLDGASILDIMDVYVNELTAVQNQTLPGGAKKFEGKFQTLTGSSSVPRYHFVGDDSLRSGLEKKTTIITVFSRQGITDPVAYERVRFMDIQYNENMDIFAGKFVHRLPGSARICLTVPVPKKAMKLPYAETLFNLYFDKNPEFAHLKKMGMGL